MRIVPACWLVVFLIIPVPNSSHAQEESILLNRHNVQPEVWNFPRPETPPVDAHGDLNLSIPVLTVPGRGMDFEIRFSYRSGITFSQRATWLGLGWSFDSGSITREPEGAVHFLNTDEPATDDPPVRSPYGVDLFDDSEAKPAQPDAYYVTLPGKGTVSFTQVNNPTFEKNVGQDLIPAVTEGDFAATTHRPWRVDTSMSGSGGVTIDGIQTGTTYDDNYNHCMSTEEGNHEVCHPRKDIERFVVTAEGGTRYVFARPTLSYFDTRYTPEAGGVAYARQVYVSTWRLVAMLGPQVTDSVPADLSGWPDDSVPGGWVRFDYENVLTADEPNPTNAPHEFKQVRFLQAIVTPTHRAEFLSEERETPFVPPDEPSSSLYKRLTDIKLYSRMGTSEQLVKQVVLRHGEGEQGLRPWREAFGGGEVRRLRLKELRVKGSDGTLASGHPGHSFDYYEGDSSEHQDLHVDESQRTDDFGYYSNNFLGGEVDSDGGRTWSLKAVDYDTGGRLEVNYENDRIEDFHVVYQRADGGTEGEYDASGTAKSNQGGPRVTELIRRDGVGTTESTTFSYGYGHATGVPSKHWRRHFTEPSGNKVWMFAPSNRGKVSVVYEWVKRTRSDGSAVKTYYTSSRTNTTGRTPNSSVRPIETVLSVDRWRSGLTELRSCGVPSDEDCIDIAVLQGNQHWNWGKPYRKEHLSADNQQVRVVERELNLSPRDSSLASVWDRGGAQADVEFGASHVKEKDVYTCPNGETGCVNALPVHKKTVYAYERATGLRTKTVTSAHGIRKTRSTTYAHERYVGMRDQNMLSQTYRKTAWHGRGTIHERSWKTWTNLDVDGDSQREWLPYRKWVWTGQ